MSDYDLSILIPARNEMFLAKTVESLLTSIKGRTEILIALDGEWANPGIPDDPRVTIVYFPSSIGQRAATNQLCRLSKAKYVMKLDAHCILDEGFDVKLMEDMEDDITMLPLMRNLHAFDWVCSGNYPKTGALYSVVSVGQLTSSSCGHRIYQGPTPEKCPKCGGNMERELMWFAKPSPKSAFFRFDKALHFQYFNELAKRPGYQGDLVETMSAQGSCFLLTREKYWELDICDEAHGSWGQQGVEIACKTWFSGGRLITNRKTWYAHMFRTQGGDFGFPYPLSGSDVNKAREYSRWLFEQGNWPGAKEGLNLEWLLKKFYPVPGWHENDREKDIPQHLGPKPKKGVIYYTDNELDPTIMQTVQDQISKGIKPKHIISASLKPLQFGKNITLDRERGYLTMAKQILAALEHSAADVIFFCEHDVLYHPSHFDFIPPNREKVYYNVNVWRMRIRDGHALYTDNLQQLSGLVGYRDILIRHYAERVRLLEEAEKNLPDPHEYNSYVRAMGFEPGTHNRCQKVDNLKAESYKSQYPNIDIRHDNNLTPSRWNQNQFRNKRYTIGWTEGSVASLPGWDTFDFASLATI